MAEINDIDLKLNIIADDQASAVFKAMGGSLDTLRASLAAFKDINPFAQMVDDADALGMQLNDLKAGFEGLREVASSVNGSNPFGEMTLELSDAYQQASMFERALASIQERMSGEGELFTPWQTDLSDVSGLVVDISGEIVTVGDHVDAIDFAQWSEPLPALLGDLGKAETQLATIQNTTKEIALTMESMGATGAGMGAGVLGGATGTATEAAGGTKGMPAWLSSLRGASGMLSELPMKMMYGSMNAMMGYYGLQALANGTSGFASIQQMKNLNNSTVNQAAQYQMMLGAAGLTGTSGVSFLQGLASNMQKTFTPTNGQLSQNAILLESLGITKQDTAQSPMMMLNTIGQRYRQLISQGRGSQASELLGLTGTTSVASLLQNWNAVESQASQTKLNMTPTQLNQAAKQNVSMQVSMQQLNLAFEQMAITLVPLVTKLTGALTALMNGFDKGKGPVNDFVSGIGGAAKQLGVLGTTIIGAIAAIKVASFTSDVLSGAGVIGDVGGGMTLGKFAGKGIKGAVGLGKRIFGAGGEAAAGAGEAAVAGEAGTVAAGAGEAAAVGTAGAAAGESVGIFASLAAGLGDVAVAAGAALVPLVAAAAPFIAIGVAIAAVVVGIVELITHWKQVTSWVAKTGHEIGQWVAHTGEKIASWASQHAKDIGQWASRTGARISTWTSEHTKDIGQWAQTTGEHIASWVSQHTRDLTAWAQTTGAHITTWASRTTSDIGTWSTETIARFGLWAVHLGSWAASLWGRVSGDFQGWTAQLSGWASKNWASVKGDFQSWTHSLTSWSGKNWAAVTGHFQSWTHSLTSWAGKNWGAVSGHFSTWTSNLQTWTSNLWPDTHSYFRTFSSNLMSWASGIVTDIDNILNGIKTTAQQIVSGTKNLINGLGNWVNNTATSIGKSVSGFFGSSSSVPASLSKSNASFVNTVRPYAEQVSKATGMPVNGLIGQWAYETGWGSSTAAKENANLGGIIPFGQYSAGRDSSYAGFNNLAQFAQADISVLNESRYAGARNMARSGASIQAIYAALSKEGYDTTNPGIYSGNVASIASQIPKLADGGLVSSPTLALVGEAGPEMVIPMNQYPVHPGAVSPLGATGTEGGGTTFNVVINVPGLGTGPAQVRQLAEMVATEFKNQVKRRGNFDWS